MHPFPVIDLFAGPGGLSEGFATCESFRVALSIEKDRTAHQTLELRAFFRQFDRADVPEEYEDGDVMQTELNRQPAASSHVSIAMELGNAASR